MKIFFPIIIAILSIIIAGDTYAGYRDMRQEMEAYTPPDMLHPATSVVPASSMEPDAFTVEKQTIEEARNRWERLVSRSPSWIPTMDLSPVVTQSADDDEKTLAVLRDPFPLETLQTLIWLRNPSIKGATARFRAALEGFDQVAQLDEILRQYSAFTASVMTGVGPMTGMGDRIEMKFPYPGVTALKGQVAEKDVEMEKRSLDMVRRDALARGGKAYWNLVYNHRALKITRDTLDQLNHLESVATTRYGAGKTSYQDVVKIRIGREKLEEQFDTLQKQRINLETELLSLVDLPPGTLLGWPRTTTPDLTVPRLETLYSLALEKRQELNRMRAMVARMERMVEMAETMIQPDFSQYYSLYADQEVLQVGSSRMKPTFATTVSTTRGRGLPKNAWFGTKDAYLAETREKLKGLRADLADAESQTRLMVRTGWFELDRARRERSLYKDRLLELSQTSLDVSTKGYETGNVSFADVIASYTGWLDVNLASERRNSDVGIARIELARRVGAPLPGR